MGKDSTGKCSGPKMRTIVTVRESGFKLFRCDYCDASLRIFRCRGECVLMDGQKSSIRVSHDDVNPFELLDEKCERMGYCKRFPGRRKELI